MYRRDDVIEVLWGKSARSGGPSRLIQHLFDTAATAELVWDRFLCPHFRASLDDAFGSEGRAAYVWIAAVHDLGKASPAFQKKEPELGRIVTEAGLPVGSCGDVGHPIPGYWEVRDYLKDLGWDRHQGRWYALMVLGHHGMFTTGKAPARSILGKEFGGTEWAAARRRIIDRLNGELGVDGPPRPQQTLNRAVQLELSAAVSMADWIASNTRAFPGLWLDERPGMDVARARAACAWERLALRGGWVPSALRDHDLMGVRFDRIARPVQELSAKVADKNPGLMIIEAPTGDGKTEAALVAAEKLARLNRCDGLFVGMPTQATSDPMFKRVLDWAEKVDSEVPVGLLHGKRQLNRDFQRLYSESRFSGVDEFGCDDEYGLPTQGKSTGSRAPAEWFLGRRRGLLMPIVVGTIDQLLMAATRTRYVGFRHLGLAGKVVILDEVHACDVYMGQFLFEALRWLAGAGVPVVLLTATLPPAMRQQLVHAYTQGLLVQRDVTVDVPATQGYPSITSVMSSAPGLVDVQVCQTAQPLKELQVSLLSERDDWQCLVATLVERLSDGGTALVVCNSVSRAQGCYQVLKTKWVDDVVLIHGRLTAGSRDERTRRLLDELGPPDSGHERPHRRIVVATQVAEQSFDIDVDLLVTDIAPIDLLIQRAGRLHRHARPPEQRGPRLAEPHMLVMGVTETPGAPQFEGAAEAIYGRWHLLSAALELHSGRWTLPEAAPRLVAGAYQRTDWPEEWSASAKQAEADRDRRDYERSGVAKGFLLAGDDHIQDRDLQGLHNRPTRAASDEEVHAVVRDGERSAEVIPVRSTGAGGYTTIDGSALGVNGEVAAASAEVLDEVIRSTIRLPASRQLADAVEAELHPLAGWLDHPWLGSARALVMTADGVELGGYHLEFDTELGLMAHRVGHR